MHRHETENPTLDKNLVPVRRKPVKFKPSVEVNHEIARWPTLRDEFPLPAGEGQGEGESGLQRSGTWRFAWRGTLFSFAQSSRDRRQFAGARVCGAFLPPHPSPLPEEREHRTLRFRQSGAPRLVAARDAVLPHLAGEAEGGLGNTGSFSSNVFKAFPSPRPAPPSFLAGRGRSESAFCSPRLCRLSCGRPFEP
jgi:hypothetical protein